MCEWRFANVRMAVCKCANDKFPPLVCDSAKFFLAKILLIGYWFVIVRIQEFEFFMSLSPYRHQNSDLFTANIFDGIPSLKDDMASMEHPIFSLSTKPDTRTLRYDSSMGYVEIMPSSLGLATIFDKDILIFCASHLIHEINRGGIPSRNIRVTAHQILCSCNRPTNNLGYDRLKIALDRLTGTRIKTNITTGGIKQIKNFGLLDSYEIIEKNPDNGRMVAIQLTVSEWFYNAIIGREVLTISKDYFRLRKPIERRLYEIARKHCGTKEEWKISLENLQYKIGSISAIKWFRFSLKKISFDDDIPDYKIILNDNDIVTFYRRNSDVLKIVDRNQFSQFKGETVERARQIIADAGTGWDFNAIVRQFAEHMEKNGNPENINGAFIGFVKKKAAQRP